MEVEGEAEGGADGRGGVEGVQASRDGQAVCGGDVERVVNGDGRGYVVRGQV